MPDNPLQPDFWENEESEMWSILVSVFVESMMDGIQGGVEALPPDIAVLMDFDVVNQAAIEYARRYRYEWISQINNTTRRQVQTLMADWIQSGAPLSSLEAQLAPIFGSTRAQLLASTEITRIFAEANQAAWETTGMVGGKAWMTGRDDLVCPICKPMDGKIVSLGNAFPNALGGGYKNPPAHPRCRCWLQPVVDVEAVNAQIERILNG